MVFFKLKLSLLLILLSFASTLSAENALTLEVKADEEVVIVKKDGTREIAYIEPESVVPGDVVRYRIFYRNLSEKLTESVVITNPIPQEVEYINGSAAGPGTKVFFSIDAAKTFDLPENLVITDRYGNQRLAAAKEYTHIQWRFTMPLPPQAEGTVSYRVKLR